MIASSVSPPAVESPSAKHSASDCQPMPRQDHLGERGHEMHLQEFVQLVGYSCPRKQQAKEPSH